MNDICTYTIDELKQAKLILNKEAYQKIKNNLINWRNNQRYLDKKEYDDRKNRKKSKIYRKRILTKRIIYVGKKQSLIYFYFVDGHDLISLNEY